MKEQLLKAWEINQDMNKLVIGHTTDAGMQKTLSTRGGRTVYQQWVHIHNARVKWLEVSARDVFKEQKALDKQTPFKREQLIQSLNDSADGVAALLARGWDDGGKVKSFKTGVIPLLGYFISHESHHRGNILLTLKQCGEKIPDALKWGLWEWGK